MWLLQSTTNKTTNATQDLKGTKLSCNGEGTPTCFHKPTLPAHHQCLFLAPPTVTHSPPEPLHTDLHSALTLPLSTNKTKISRAALRLGGCVPLTDNAYYRTVIRVSVTFDIIVKIAVAWWWWRCSSWTLLQQTLTSSAAYMAGEYGRISSSKEGTSQRNGPCMINLTHYTLKFIFYKSFWGYWYLAWAVSSLLLWASTGNFS